MGYKIEKEILSSEQIMSRLPLTKKLEEEVNSHRRELFDIFEGKDKRKILIIGPCSAWPAQAVVEYAKMIKKISNEVEDKIKIVLRVYTQKPRTTKGWLGSANQPNPFMKPDIEGGLIYCREMMIDILDLGFAIADEALFTHKDSYLNDLLSYMAIGARSTEDQEHRIYASMIEHPVGLKNPTSGDIKKGINSVIAAHNPHIFLLNQKQIKTTGNKHAHLILRGGNLGPNIFYEDLVDASNMLDEADIENKSIIIDVSHDNSIDPATMKKDASFQPNSLLRVLEHMEEDKNLNDKIKGFMLESFIKEGKQNIEKLDSFDAIDLEGLSITDACIGIDDTVDIIRKIYERLK